MVEVDRRSDCASLYEFRRVWTNVNEYLTSHYQGDFWQSVIEDRQWELPYPGPLVLCALFLDDTPYDRHSHLVYRYTHNVGSIRMYK